jgi:hypothetical protein
MSLKTYNYISKKYEMFALNIIEKAKMATLNNSTQKFYWRPQGGADYKSLYIQLDYN